jgi:L-ascorbate metabolism protein UlaG (beta-lactamase superfamily)
MLRWMEIYWLGHGCFRLRGKEATVLTDPCPPTTGYRIGKVNADIVTISTGHADSNYRQAVQGDAKVISGPGEYEIAGVLITGVRTDHDLEGNRNVAYVFDIDDVRICHLGSPTTLPTGDDVEILASADILIVPVGGGREMDAERAVEAVSLLEPKIVIPMKYKTDASTGELDPVEKFLREIGAEAKAAEQRLSVTKSNLPHDRSIVLLNYRGA